MISRHKEEAEERRKKQEPTKVEEIIQNKDLEGLKALIDSGWGVNTIYKEVRVLYIMLYIVLKYIFFTNCDRHRFLT